VIVDDEGSTPSVEVRFRDRIVPPSRWSLWTQRPSLVVYCLLVECLAVSATVLTAGQFAVRPRDLFIFAALAGMGVIQAELGRQVERVRRRVNGTPHINMTSVWTGAAVLLLPPVLVTILVAVLYAHLALRSWYRLRRVPAFRTVFNASLVVLTCYAAKAALVFTGVGDLRRAIDIGWAGAAAVGVALVAYFVAGALLAVPGLNTAGKRTPEVLFGTWADNLLELATLCLGALTALALATLPGLAVLVVPPLLLLHRGVLVRQLEFAATRDEKTGLFNTTGWHRLATHELARAKRANSQVGVLMVDLDHFKRVNDTYGHLAGDVVLKAVAGAISSEVRDYDAVGRFGGEEFVVLVSASAERDVFAVAERIRHAIARLEISVSRWESGSTTIAGLSASIGIATYPEAGTVLQKVLHAADVALYQAKNTGRNKVVLGRPA
jgi:diguanylate cyclase (GGDEF)-like protein